MENKDQKKEHDDAAQDKELIMKMLKQHMGDGASDEEMQAAMEAYEFMKKEGHKEEDAAKMGCAGVKMAKHFAEKHAEGAGKEEGEDAKKDEKKDEEKKDSKESDDKKEESKESKESKEGKEMKESAKMKSLEAENVKLKGALAGFEAEKQKTELAAHLEAELSKTKLPRSATAKFRESVKDVKSKKEVDKYLSIFIEGFKNRGESMDDAFVLGFEKNPGSTEGKSSSDISFDDCVND